MAEKKARGSGLGARGKRPEARKDVPIVSTHREQTERWVKGDSVHVRVGSSWECCPDFSCCYPDLQRPKAERVAFSKADSAAREAFYSAALGALVQRERGGIGRVHIVGQVPRRGPSGVATSWASAMNRSRSERRR